MARLTVRRVLNNNVVQVIDARGQQLVLMGRGIGHGKKPGDAVSDRGVQQRFVSDGGHHALRRLTEFVNDTPLDQLLVAGEALALAHRELGITPSQSLLLPIADHLSFALHRNSVDVATFTHPLRWEVRQLYPKEATVGDQILTLVQHRLDVQLPKDEAIAFAMHLVSAQFGEPDFAGATRMTELIRDALTTVSRHFGKSLDEESLAVSRFVTHLRYLLVRINQDRATHDPGKVPAILTTVRDSYPHAAACAADIQHAMEQRVGRKLPDEDITYLTLHVARLAESSP